MKKLFAISLILAIAASAAFAELTIGGTAGYGVTVIKGDNSDDSVPGVGTAGPTGRLQAVYANDEDSFGALVRVQTIGDAGRIFAWWQPLSQLKLTLGKDGNGQFGLEQIVGWGWNAGAGDYGVGYSGAVSRGDWSAGGFGDYGATLALTPITGLAINVAVPYDKSKEAPEVYNHISGQLIYNIADVGEIGVTYKSGAGYRNWGPTAQSGTYVDANGAYQPWAPDKELPDDATAIKEPVKGDTTKDPGVVYAQFYLTAIQNLQLNIGGKYTLGGTIEDAAGVKTTYTPAIKAGFGVNYNISDTIGVKARLGAGFAGKTEVENKEAVNAPFELGFDVMPYFDLGILKLSLNLGVEYVAEKEQLNVAGKVEKVKDSQVFAWFVNPYITKSVGGGTFFAGFQLYSDGVKDSDDKTTIKWGVPIGIEVGF
jgi:hypothetical protein